MNNKISEQQFITSYVKNQPNKFTKFMYKNFGMNNGKLTIYQHILLYIFIIFNVIGITTINIPIILFPNIVLIIIVICGFISVFMNKLRIKKICKELNISEYDFNIYSEKYMKK